MSREREVFYGQNMNKKILFVSATHGDEGFSIEVLDELERKYPKDKYGYDRIIGNPKALVRNARFIEKDLNRSAPGNLRSEVYEKRRAAEIMKITKNFDCVVDLHGANTKCGVVIIICKPTLSNFALATMFNIKRIVVWYETKRPSGPLTQFCLPLGFEIECGPKTDPKIKKELGKVLKDFLLKTKKMTIEDYLKKLKDKEIYVVYAKKKGNEKLQDFIQVKTNKEEYYPFMSNQYPGIACYKMKKINLEDLFLRGIKL